MYMYIYIYAYIFYVYIYVCIDIHMYVSVSIGLHVAASWPGSGSFMGAPRARSCREPRGPPMGPIWLNQGRYLKPY